MLAPTVLFEHQPRERRVPCQSCRTPTSNDHAICTSCLLAGTPVACSQLCRDAFVSVTSRAGLAVPDHHLQFA